MAEPRIVEVQQHIIEMEAVWYRLVHGPSTTMEPPDKRKHQSWCWRCAGHEPAPREDEDRLTIFDHFCYGHHHPLLCDPFRGIIYEKISV
jgi:hypothetical protein